MRLCETDPSMTRPQSVPAFALVLGSATVTAKLLAGVVRQGDSDVLDIPLRQVQTAHPAIIVRLLFVIGTVWTSLFLRHQPRVRLKAGTVKRRRFACRRFST